MASGLAPAALSSLSSLRLDDASWALPLKEVEDAMMQAVRAHAGAQLTPMIFEHLEAGGKRLRARLALAAGDALAAPMPAMVAWAASCELMHNATLVHDDVQDGDTVRRGKPTVWCRYGQAQAINVGDLLLMLPYHLVTSPQFDAAVSGRLTRALAHYIMTVIVGQASECDMTAEKSGSLPMYLDMVRGKTAALFELPVVGAALVAQHTEAQAFELARGFAPLGVLFQLQDDVIDLFGDKGRNQSGADIYEGKMSALVLEYLARRPGDSAWLLNILQASREKTRPEDVAEVAKRFEQSGSLAGVLKTMTDEAAKARALCHPKMSALLQQLIERIMKPIAPLMALHLPSQMHAGVSS